MTFPTIPTPEGPQHTFRDLAPVVAPPFQWQMQAADVQVFDPDKIEEERKPVMDLFCFAQQGK